MKTVNLIKTLVLITLMAFMASCTKDDNVNRVSIRFQSTYQTAAPTNQKNALASDVTLESFKINIAEIEIEFDDDDPLFENDSVASEYELKGPFEIDLMHDGEALQQIIVSNLDLPSAAYDEIEFEFDKNTNSSSEMYKKTVVITGDIYETPFTFWSDEEMELEIEFDEVVYIDDVSNALLTVSFDLDLLFNPALGGIDITNAKDGNGDGVIEISPKDTDGNNELAERIYKKLEKIIEAFEDRYDD